MIRKASRFLLLVLLFSFVSPASRTPVLAEPQPAAGTRLVVFEGYYKVT